MEQYSKTIGVFPYRFFSFLVLTFALVSCGKIEGEKNVDRFTGFVKAGEKAPGSQFLVELKSIQLEDGVVTFKFVRILAKGYAIQTASTNCKDLFQGNEGVQYTDDGTSDRQYPADKDAIAIGAVPGISELTRLVCAKVNESRGFAGDFDGNKALSIPAAVAPQSDTPTQGGQPQRQAKAPAIVSNKDGTERLTPRKAGSPLAPSPIAAPVTTGPKPTDIGVACPTQIAPEMPRKAQQEGTEGVVKAQIHIGKGGVIQDITIISGPRVFYAAVKAAMMQYKCVSDGGDVIATQEFNFKLTVAANAAGNGQNAQLSSTSKLGAGQEALPQNAGDTGAPNSTGTALHASGPSAGYAGRIRARIAPNIVFADAIAGNPVADVEVRTASDGTIVSRKLTQASGVKSWDDAVLKAIDKTEVLPRDLDGRVPPVLTISFRPKG